MLIKILDLDGSLINQPALKKIPAINVQSFAAKTRIIARKSVLFKLTELIGAVQENQPEIIFYGSGDFHHLTAALVSRHAQPLTIIHFDNHPDWVKFPATFNCGAWVNRALDMVHVVKVITLGVNCNDLENPDRKSANLQALQNGTLELYPWYHQPSYVKGSYGRGMSYEQQGSCIHWNNLSTKNWPDFTKDLVKTISTEAVYITIDKDVLGTNEATTNWDQGSMPLTHVTSMIKAISEKLKIVGIDVCGDYSPPKFYDPLRFFLAYFDHPKNLNPTRADLDINSSTNQKLIDCFMELK